MIKKKVPYTLLTATALATLLSSVAFAAKGDFYYGDASNLTRVQKSEIKDKKDELKANKDNLYYQIDDTNIVKYSDYILKIVTGWSTGSIGDAVVAANADATIRASADIVQKAAQVDAGEETGIIVSSVSAITATDVTVVLAEKPAADPTVDDFTLKVNDTAVAAPTSVNKVASDLTGKTYKLTIASLANTEGSLTVNGVEKAFDFKAPEVVSVAAKGTKTIEVTFNEAIKDTTAIDSNFKVAKVSDPTGNISTGTVALSADGTKATVALDKDLTVADYILKLGDTAPETATNRVKDIAGNSIYGGTEISFRPTADQLAVKEAPSVTSVSYNNGTGVATVTFNKDVLDTNVDVTKLTLGGVALTTSDVVAQGATANSVTITLSADTKEAVNAVTGTLSFVGAEGAWTDGTTATTGQTVTVSKVTPAVVSSASYNQETKVLTINFDQAVTINSLAGIYVDDAVSGSDAVATGATNPDGTALDTTKASATWNLKLADGEAADLENAANDKAKLKVYLAADAVRNDSTTIISNVATTYADGGVAVVYTADTTKPYVTGAEYSDNTNKLTITFNEALDAISVTNVQAPGAVNIATAATGDDNAFDLSAETASLDTTKKVLTIDLSASANKTKLNAEYLTGKAIKVSFAKDVLVDENNLKNDATTFDTGIALTYHDFTAPKLDTTTGATDTLNQTYVKAVFTEPVDKTTAETAANYVIKDLAGNTLTVNSAVLQSDKKTVYLNTAAQESGKPYTLTVNNVRDLQQNLIDTTANNKSFYGSSAASTGKLGVNSTLVATAPANSKNDTLAVTFDAPVNQTQALDLSNYSVLETTAAGSTPTDAEWAAATAVPLTDATAKIDSAGTTVTITLGSYNLQAGKYYKVVVGNVTDAYGNALDSTKTSATTAVDLNADNLTEPSITETNTKAGAVVLTFDQELNATEAAKVANYKVGSATPSKATYAWDAVKGKATVTLDVATALIVPTDVQIKNAVTNLAGETIDGASYPSDFATIDAPATLGDTVAPTVKTVVAKANPNAGNDVITVTFNDNDIFETSVVANDIVVKDAQGTVIPASDYTVAFGDGTPDTITVTFDGQGDPDKAYNLQNGDNYTVTITGVVDLSGNELADTTATATWDAATDTAAPEIATPTGLAVTTGIAGNGNIKVTFNEDVDAATATNKASYVVKAGSTTLTPSYVTYASKTATVYFAEELTNAAYDVTVTNVKDLAGNITTGSNQTIAATAEAAPEIAGVSADDATGVANDGKTLLTLPSLPSGASKFVYKVESDGSAVETPRVGDDLSSWTDVPVDNLIATTNGYNVGIAAVDASGKAVQFKNVSAVVIDYIAATSGSSVGSIAIADDSALAALTTSEDVKDLVFTIDGVVKTYTIDSSVTTKADFLTALNGVLGSAGTASFDGSNYLKVVSATTGTSSIVEASGDAAAAIVGTPTENAGTAEAN